MNIVIEGLDRLGKTTLAANLENKLGCFTHIHFGKPPILEKYVETVGALKAKEEYQRNSFALMFQFLSGPGRFMLDRGHLGEAVYAKRYRNYDGSYVFDYETVSNGDALTNTLLVLLVNNDPKLEELLVDDGESFDWTKRKEEQDDFIKAFERSRIVNKIIVYVSNGNGQFLDQDIIASMVATRYNDAVLHTR